MALAKLLPLLRSLDQALAEMQLLRVRTKRTRRSAARALTNSSGLLVTIEKLSLEPAPETKGDEKAPYGPERAGRTKNN